MSRPRLSFTVVGELFKGQVFLFDGEQPISIGRTADNAMPLDHKSVSRLHATVECNGETVVLRDLGSHNGTRVGDRLVTEHVLQPGDIVGFGEVLLRFSTVDGAGAPGGSSATIFDMLGREVVKLSGDPLQWDGRNERGDMVSAGTYMFVVELPSGEKHTGKIAVVK